MDNNCLLYIFLLLVLAGCACPEAYTEIQQITLDKGWVFHPGDDPVYAQSSSDDTGWDAIKPSLSWQQQGFNLAGFAWYRNRIMIPSSFKRNDSASITFVLGVIKDSDQVFLNGKPLGENGRTVDREMKNDSAFTLQGSRAIRKYMVTANDPRIRWDQENLIAIRVFEKGTRGGAGMISGIPYIREVTVFDSIIIDPQFYRYDQNKGLADTMLTIINISSQPINGDLELKAITETGKILLSKNLALSLNAGDTLATPVSLPGTTDQIKVLMNFRNDGLRRMKRDSLIIPFILFK